ncbi:translational GTPase TypA [Gammaproteobacteria bacterium]|nr:translational GTPase TypA [Gammaproteobacteria bacterium]MDC3202904.1 translational GTPase TypA [Gammaproteobacteria bacterium]
MSTEKLRNLAIVAHVDHGKTTLVDELLKQTGTLDHRRGNANIRVMDSNDIEQERGITILAKNTSLRWKDYRINIVDTPGHADFGGEVERILSMVDSVLLLVDAVDGPMPQTRFVTQKAFQHGLKPLVVINKCDRDGARPSWVLDRTFDLFDKLGATDEQLDFPVIYASALQGYARIDENGTETTMDSLFEAIVKYIPPPPVNLDGPLQMQISSLDYSSYVGAIGIGRITRGTIKTNQPLVIIDRDGISRRGKVLEVLGFQGLEREVRDSAEAGDIIAITGIDKLRISDTLCDPDHPDPMTPLSVDEPTVSMTFEVSDSPFAGKEGKFVTSRQILERLEQELIANVALRVEKTEDPKILIVSGRGELHISILIENMRREGFAFCVGRPQVIVKEVDGVKSEPFEQVVVDVPEEFQGAVMERLGTRRGSLQNMQPDGTGRVRLDYTIPARGLIGFRTEFMTATAGNGLIFSSFDGYRPLETGLIGARNKGVLISNGNGKALAFALFNLQERGRLFTGHGDEIFEGMIIGQHSRDNDLVVNPLKAKQLNNIRAAGTDENLILSPPIVFDLERALEFIADDELVEVTPKAIRLRKRQLTENERKRTQRSSDKAEAS